MAKKKKFQKHRICAPEVCDDCVYICEGDFLCEKQQEIVVADWQPTEYFMQCGGTKHGVS